MPLAKLRLHKETLRPLTRTAQGHVAGGGFSNEVWCDPTKDPRTCMDFPTQDCATLVDCD